MKTQSFFRNLIALISLFGLLLTACAPAATPAPIAIQPAQTQPQVQNKPQTYTRPAEPTKAPQPTRPLATRPALPAPQQPAEVPPAALPPVLSVPTPAGNSFQDYGVNPFVDTYEDHLSTFALDVDTAAYAVARRYVEEGNLPPYEAVRVEEFVNYFDSGYPTPADVAFGLYADGAPSPWPNDGTHILRFGVQGYQVPDSERKPASLVFVIDISGSMDMENRLGLVKRSLELLVERLRPVDTVGIVAYGTEARIVLNPTSGEEEGAILNAIYSLRTEGATNAEGGLRLGYDMAWRAFRPEGTNRVILCSDGVANVGETGPQAILEFIRNYANAGITLTTVGFGMGNFNDVLMEQLADGGDGNYAYVDDLDQARRLFVDDLTSTLQVIALDAKVQVDFNPDTVAYYRLIGYENRDVADQNFRNDAVDAGEIGAGHSVTALYAVQLRPNATGRMATMQLRWEDPQSHTVQEINGNFNTWDLAPDFSGTDPHYQLAVVVSQYAELLRQSPWVGNTSIFMVLDHAVRLAGLFPGDADVNEFAALVSRASQITALSR